MGKKFTYSNIYNIKFFFGISSLSKKYCILARLVIIYIKMNTKGFFDFYNTIYTYDKGQSVINALRYRKMTFSHWAEGLFKKRKNCEACIFTCFLENDKFKEQLVMYENRFKKSLSGYARSRRFDVEYDIKKNHTHWGVSSQNIIISRTSEIGISPLIKPTTRANPATNREVPKISIIKPTNAKMMPKNRSRHPDKHPFE